MKKQEKFLSFNRYIVTIVFLFNVPKDFAGLLGGM